LKLALALALLARVAWAEPITIHGDDIAWRLDLPPGWEAADPPELPAGRALAAYTSDGRQLLVARLRINTDGAYDGKSAYFAGVEDGVQKETLSYHRLAGGAHKLGKRRRLPAFDLWYRGERAIHGARFVFLRGYVVVLRIDLPEARTVERAAKRLLESFQPG